MIRNRWKRKTRRPSSAQQRSPSARRNPTAYETLEPRRLLFSDFVGPVAYTPTEIDDVFARQAVSVEEMVERAKYVRYMPNEVIVAVEVPVAKSAAAQVAAGLPWQQMTGHAAASVKRVMQSVDRGADRTVALVHLDLGARGNVLAALHLLETREGVLWSSPNFTHSRTDPRDFIPNDPLYGNQYHHNNMNNPLAWDVSLGNPNIIVGVTDDGVLLTHPDLQPNIWVNPGEIPGNGIDDDNNGYIDDVNGWDFSSGNNNPNPNGSGNDHGTHVAGIAAARTHNGIGIAGTAGLATIMPLQFYAGTSSWTAAIINETYTYAADNGAHIVTTSYNVDGWVGDPVFLAGLQYMYDGGVLHFNSAGNNNQLNPPRQSFEQSLFVSSLDQNNVRSSFSNYGIGIDIAGHGSNIYSTVLNNNYGTKSGTSMSTPNAAGAAALLWGVHPAWNRYQVAAHLLATSTNIDAQNPNYVGWLGAGMVNTGAALNTATIAAPRVKSLTGLPAAGSTSSNFNVTGFTVTFDQVMDPATVNNMSNFQLRESGRDGIFGTADDRVFTVSADRTYRVGTNWVNYSFSGGPLGPGNYRLTLLSGGLRNPFGTALDGNGDGVGGDSLNHSFKLEPVITQVLPAGSMVYEQQFPGTIAAAQETDRYYIDLDAGQTLLVVMRGSGNLVPNIQVRDPNNALLGSGGGSGSTARTAILPISLGGRYEIAMSGASNSTGTYTTIVALNGGWEGEEIGGPTNDTLATAEDIDPTSMDLGDQSSRAAIRGNLGPVVLASENFESGGLGSQWQTSTSSSAGRIRITGQHGTAGGNFAMLMDVNTNNVYSLNSATWTVNLAGVTSAMLSFWHASWADEIHTMPTSFTNASNSDGVAISANGTNWFRIYTPSGSMPAGQWQQQSVDLVAAAQGAGISLNNNFRIRFQQYDNYPITTDGRGYDEIAINGSSGAASDWYSFTLGDGEIASVAATAASGGLTVELYNSGGTLLRTGGSKNNVSSFIDRFADTTSNGVPDRYYARVTGGSGAYSLVVTRNGQFDAEPNDTTGTAQLINGVQSVMGFATTASDYFRFSAQSGENIAFDATLPGQGPYLFVNGLDGATSQLRMQLIAPGGGVVASGNSSLEHTAAVSGDYHLRVWANSGSGEYLVARRLEPASIKIESGMVTVDGGAPVTVHLTQSFVDPIVILGPAMNTASEPVVGSVFNVTSNSFDLTLATWNLDGDPSFTETVQYLVVERGTTVLEGDNKLVAGSFDTLTSAFTAHSFSAAFQSTPVVIATVHAPSTGYGQAVRLQNVTASGFEARAQLAELLDLSIDAITTVNYVALDPGRYELPGWTLEAGLTPNAVTHAPYAINYSQPFPAVPFLGAQIQTMNDSDPAAVRQISGSSTGASIYLMEETSVDPETTHGTEIVGWWAVAPVSGLGGAGPLDNGDGAVRSSLANGLWSSGPRSDANSDSGGRREEGRASTAALPDGSRGPIAGAVTSSTTGNRSGAMDRGGWRIRTASDGALRTHDFASIDAVLQADATSLSF